MELNASRSCELPRLETLAAEHRAALGRTEGHGGLLAARRAARAGFDALAADAAAARRARGALRLAALAAFRLVFEVFVGEEQLLAGGPDEGGPTVDAFETLVLELHATSLTRPCYPATLTGCRP